jgi:hypothetical protein
MFSRICRDQSASSLVAASDISCQSPDRTARAWMIAMCFAQILINWRLVRDERSPRGSGIHLPLPDS